MISKNKRWGLFINNINRYLKENYKTPIRYRRNKLQIKRKVLGVNFWGDFRLKNRLTVDACTDGLVTVSMYKFTLKKGDKVNLSKIIKRYNEDNASRFTFSLLRHLNIE